jgi:hypothetical protein
VWSFIKDEGILTEEDQSWIKDLESNTVAVKPSRDLVAALSRAIPPSGQEQCVRDALKGACWYIDIPDRALLVGEAQVRALFTLPHFVEKGITGCAILSPLGSNELLGRIFWLFDGPANAFQGVSTARGIDPVLLRRQVEDFLSLLVLYRTCAAKAERGVIPYKEPAQMIGRRADQNRKKFSMFRVETLSPPPDRFGRAASSEDRNGWKLGWRSEVAGHFKMQAHGPRHSLRKLIFVESFERGPKGAPRKHTLERMDLRAD